MLALSEATSSVFGRGACLFQGAKSTGKCANWFVAHVLQCLGRQSRAPPEAQNSTRLLPLDSSGMWRSVAGSAMNSRNALGAWTAPLTVRIMKRERVAMLSLLLTALSQSKLRQDAAPPHPSGIEVSAKAISRPTMRRSPTGPSRKQLLS